MAVRRIAGLVRRLLRDERGAISGETLLYIPLFLAIIFAMADARVLFQKHSEMWTAARDAARGVARSVSDSADAEERVRHSLKNFTAPIEVLVQDDNVVVIEVRADFTEESYFGLIGALASRMPARVIMRREPSLLDRLG